MLMFHGSINYRWVKRQEKGIGQRKPRKHFERVLPYGGNALGGQGLSVSSEMWLGEPSLYEEVSWLPTRTHFLRVYLVSPNSLDCEILLLSGNRPVPECPVSSRKLPRVVRTGGQLYV